MATVRIGISGWRYPPWRGVFYPKGLPQRSELSYAAGLFPAIELNGSFYSLQRPSSYGAWAGATPRHFQFAVKAPRYVTHIRRLRDVDTPVANFLASGLLRLGAKLGPILWQLPPSFAYDGERLEAFLKSLPKSTKEAARLARRHDDKLRWRAWLKTEKSRRLRHALEVRHRSFETPEFVAQLRRHGVALVVADTAGRWPLLEDVTADFLYLRLHGDEELYCSGYTTRALGRWAAKIEAWVGGGLPEKARTVGAPGRRRKSGRDVYVFFDNDVKVHAPFDAMALAHRLALGPPPLERGGGEVTEEPRTAWPVYARHG